MTAVPSSVIGRSERHGRLFRRVLVAAFVVVLGYLVLAPLFTLQARSFDQGAQGYGLAFGNSGVGRVVLTTIQLALGSLAIALVAGTGLAWASLRLPHRAQWLRSLPMLPIVVPAIASVVGWAFLLSPRPGYLNALMRNLPWWSGLREGPADIYTVPWIIIVTGVALTAFVYLFVSAGLTNINMELIEAAQVSGSSPLGAFLKVTLPLLRPALVYAGGVCLLLALGQFTAPLLLGTNQGIGVLTTEMYREMANRPPQYGVAAAYGAPLILSGIVIVVAQRRLLARQDRFVTHGGKAFRTGGDSSWWAAVAVGGYFVISTLLPLLALVAVALSPFWTGSLDTSQWTLDAFREVMSRPNILAAIRNSILLSLGAVAIALPIGFITATVITRRRGNRLVRGALDVITSAPLGIPAVLFGAGFLLAYSQGPLVLYGSRSLLIIVYVTLMLPFTTRMQLAGMAAIGESYDEASRVCGAGLLRTTLHIWLPLMRSTFAGAAALMFVLLSHEFTASVLVRTPTQQVMGTVLFDFWTNGSYPTVAAIALVMSGVTLVGVLLAIRTSGSDVLRRL